MQIVNNEFFYSSEKFNDGEAHHDFTDNTPAFSSSDRLKFLTNYADFVKKAYDLPDKPEVVFSEEKAKAELSKALLNEAETL